jgi:N-acetylmuramoyl-L-alanine amidase
VPLDDAAHVGEADTGALGLINAVETLKHAKQLVGLLHVEADAVVTDEDDSFGSVCRRRADFDLAVLARA